LLSQGFESAELDAATAIEIAEVDAAFTFARSSDYPAPHEAFEHVFAQSRSN
jgi:TPP-dependent pyruvate/acetoin dehydrogenase alpha subunit